MEKLYYTYILASKSRSLYTGVTNDLARRVYEHRNGLVPGFTSKYRIDRLVHYEMFRDVREAIAREKEIKGWSRAKRIALIEAQNRTWEDLADGLLPARNAERKNRSLGTARLWQAKRSSG